MNLLARRRPNSGGTSYSGYDATLSQGYATNYTPASVDLSVRIWAGKGQSVITICIQPQDFERVAQAMMNVDPAIAIKAFGAAMVAGNQSEPHPILKE